MADRRDDVRPKDRTSAKYATKKAAAERIAAQRAVQQRKERQRRLMMVGTSALVVVGVIVVLVVVALGSKKSSGSGNPVVAASSTVTNALTTAAGLTSASPDFSTVKGPPSTLNGAALTGANGKPEVLYVGAEYCPHCGNTRWPLAVALSRFGTFTGLKTTYSADSDSPSHVPTLSFHGSSYTSQYVDFVGVENLDGVGKPLESLSAAESQLFNGIGGGAYPFIDFGGKWMQKGDVLDPTILTGMTPDGVAKAITDPKTKQGGAVLASADVYTAIICESTNNQPANVCSAAGVTAAESALHGGS